MRNQKPREETGRVLAVAAALWASVIAAAVAEGAFARFDTASVAVLGAFISLFAVASLFLDPQLRDYARRMDAVRGAVLAIAALAGLVVALALRSQPFAMLFAPFAALAVAAVVARGIRGARLTPAARAKSPGARRAAT